MRALMTFAPLLPIKANRFGESVARLAVHPSPIIGGSCHEMMKLLQFSFLSVTLGIVIFAIAVSLHWSIRGI